MSEWLYVVGFIAFLALPYVLVAIWRRHLKKAAEGERTGSLSNPQNTNEQT